MPVSGVISGERERRIWAPVTSKVIPHMDVPVNALGGIQGKNGPKYVDLSHMDKVILH